MRVPFPVVADTSANHGRKQPDNKRIDVLSTRVERVQVLPRPVMRWMAILIERATDMTRVRTMTPVDHIANSIKMSRAHSKRVRLVYLFITD